MADGRSRHDAADLLAERRIGMAWICGLRLLHDLLNFLHIDAAGDQAADKTIQRLMACTMALPNGSVERIHYLIAALFVCDICQGDAVQIYEREQLVVTILSHRRADGV